MSKAHNKIHIEDFIADSRVMVTRVHDDLQSILKKSKIINERKLAEEGRQFKMIVSMYRKALTKAEDEMNDREVN
jgi:hypothetical protein